jgi:hypothetical protein
MLSFRSGYSAKVNSADAMQEALLQVDGGGQRGVDPRHRGP